MQRTCKCRRLILLNSLIIYIENAQSSKVFKTLLCNQLVWCPQQACHKLLFLISFLFTSDIAFSCVRVGLSGCRGMFAAKHVVQAFGHVHETAPLMKIE